MGSADSSSGQNRSVVGDPPAVSAGRRRLHLHGERALGLESLNVRSGGGGQSATARPAGAAQPKLAVETLHNAPLPARPAPAVMPVTPDRPPIAASASNITDLYKAKPFASVVLGTTEKLAVLQQLDEQHVKPCTKCGLCRTRTHTVFGEGDADARLMFIGEGPGGEEDACGRPFVGRAGKLLEKMINAMGLSRQAVFIANIVKCRAYHVEPSPKDRPPSPQEVAACSPYLLQQIEVIRPAVIVTLGLPASQFLLESKLAMGKLRGNWAEFRGLKVMPTYHPSYVLRNYTDETRALVWGDLQKVMLELGLKK